MKEILALVIAFVFALRSAFLASFKNGKCQRVSIFINSSFELASMAAMQ